MNNEQYKQLSKIQSGLDERIVDQHGLEGRDLLDKKILALQVELGELANEWRGFKFWSKDQEPRTFDRVFYPERSTFIKTNPLLEEYVDCLHFILGIGLEKNFTHMIFEPLRDRENDITFQFNQLFNKIGNFQRYQTTGNFIAIKSLFFGLGEMLGFTTDQIVDAYMSKNEVNYARQDNAY
ncbi:dUTP diphosphatase [Virgibacillus sp. CBA3643]|uniref:dUTP diphosphatase n=1 Tax=Virgibacillus sp. CBA3643 TaxID=2942278 RepID=UPI0035A3AF2A